MITGVFVDSAIQTSNSQRDIQIEREMELKDSFLKSLKGFFEALDTDGSGSIHLEEIKIMLQDGPDIEKCPKIRLAGHKVASYPIFCCAGSDFGGLFCCNSGIVMMFFGRDISVQNGGFYWKSGV